MKTKEKKMIISIVVIGVIIIVALLIWRNNANKNKANEKNEQENTVTEKYVDVLEDGTKLNKSNKLHETKKIDGLEIAGIQLTHKNGLSVILADVRNTTSQDIGLTVVEVTLYDDKNNVLEKVEGLISPVKAGESVQLNMGVSADYANAYDFTVVKK